MARRVIDRISEAVSENRRFFALEFFPPKTPEGESNLYPRMEKLSRQLQPHWCGLTHGDAPQRTLNIAHTAQSVLSIDMQINITASLFPTYDSLNEYLEGLKGIGIRNLLLLRGVTAPPEDCDFHSAADLVKFVRKRFGNFFCIAVAGHPLGYDDDTSTYDMAMSHLREKVKAGVDLVITSMCFSAPVVLKFCADCFANGIKCPIIPGIMPVQSRAQFRHWFDKPGCEDLKRRVQQVNRDDDAEVKRIGVEFTTSLLKQLFRGGVRGAYFFTMNMESVISSIIERCGLNNTAPKELPWRQSADMSRSQRESQRPIYWSGRPTSYMARTLGSCDEFPNGRYGDAMSPAFGENTTYHTALALSATARRCHWMYSAKTLRDACGGFVAFLEGRGRLPWCEETLAPEADVLLESTLKPLNRRGLLTINSQPAENALPSEDPRCGWGPPGGFVYQKQYLEFFCSRQVLDRVISVFRGVSSLAYMALDSKGNVVEMGNGGENSAMSTPTVTSGGGPRFMDGAVGGAADAHETSETSTTVTWGVFPNRPILQPTTVSLAAFRAWAPEAFSLWKLPFVVGALQKADPSSAASTGSNPGTKEGDGASETNPTSSSEAGSGADASSPVVRFDKAAIAYASDVPASMPDVLRTIATEWVLVSVVDNDFVSRPTPLDGAVQRLCELLPEIV